MHACTTSSWILLAPAKTCWICKTSHPSSNNSCSLYPSLEVLAFWFQQDALLLACRLWYLLSEIKPSLPSIQMCDFFGQQIYFYLWFLQMQELRFVHSNMQWGSWGVRGWPLLRRGWDYCEKDMEKRLREELVDIGCLETDWQNPSPMGYTISAWKPLIYNLKGPIPITNPVKASWTEFAVLWPSRCTFLSSPSQGL